FITKITLARCIVNKPKLLMISSCYEHFDTQYMDRFLNFVTNRAEPWTLLTVSNAPIVRKACDTVILLNAGKLVAEGTYASLEGNPFLSKCIK
ncbi:MAG: hypothetical protein QMB03_12410, partial [Spirosomataceae bacterium]